MCSRAVLLTAALWLFAGCATAARQPSVAAPVPSCQAGFPGGAPVATRDTVTVGLQGSVDPTDAPVPTNDAERFVFRSAYQTLVTVGCDGTVDPALAERWTSDSSGRVWTFELRHNARFWDGIALHAADVVVTWMRAPLPSGWRVSAASPTTLVVRVTDPLSSAAVFAAPRLAIARVAPDGGWPIGSGPDEPITMGKTTVLRPVWTRDTPIAVYELTDPRDALDAGFDAVVTADAAVLAYARRRGDYADEPLPWAVTYALAVPPGTAWEPSDTALAEAVRADARLAHLPAWWMQTLTCASNDDPPAASVSERSWRIEYRAADPVARDLANRIAATGVPGRLIATGVDSEALAGAHPNIDQAFVVTRLPRRVLDVCAARDAVRPRGWTFVPLVDVRAHALTRRGAPSWTIDWDGTLRPAIEGAR